MNQEPPPFMLSVSGVRGIVGATMTPEVAARFAAAFGSHLREKNDGIVPRVAVGLDGRCSGPPLAQAAMAGLAAVGCDVVNIGISATPTVGIMIEELGCVGGMNITASHNPIEWNGLKCLDEHGIAPVPEEAEKIIARFKEERIDWVQGVDTGKISQDDRGVELHVDRVIKVIDPKPIRKCGFRVILDSINSSGCLGGKALLDAYGCTVEHINGELTGVFAHTPEPIASNLEDLASAVAADETATCGFAQDPDADRLAVIDENGRFIGEEYTLVLAALRMLQIHGSGIIAANLSTSRMIDDIASRFPGSRVIRTAVGEANVVDGLKSNSGLIGGEGNGGVILPPVCMVRDSLSAMALILDLLRVDGRPLSEIVDSIPRYAMIKRKVDLSKIGGIEIVDEIFSRILETWPGAKVNDIDGIRVDLDEGWVHLRASNTEPIVRLIVEASDDQTANAIIDEAAHATGLG